MADYGEFDQLLPTGPAKEVVSATWARVLGIATIDPDIGFFDLGATSADMVVVVEQLRARWPSLRVVDLFLYPTVSGLTAFLNNDTTAQD